MTINAKQRLEKLARIRSGSAPRLLELCSGCGGLSLGLQAAGFDLVGHVEFDPTAAASYALNFTPPSLQHRDSWAVARDMEATDPTKLGEEIGLEGEAGQHFDVLAAGLPCQAFARIGRSKLRSVTGDDDAYRNDPRAKLYQRFLHFVRVLQPVAILIENVPDILNFGGHNVPEEICETLDELGYVARYTLLNAAFYGVPQMRERLFLVALDKNLGVSPSFPEPTCAVKLPPGYASARATALKHVPEQGSRFASPPTAQAGLDGAVTAREAIGDLPKILEHFKAPKTMKRRKTTEVLSYRNCTTLSAYATHMRNWPGHGGTITGTDGHVVRVTPRDFPIFSRMKRGGDYPHAHKVALELFAARAKHTSPPPIEGSEAWTELYAETVPPYDPGKFPNKWWKLDPDKPSRTLTAHMGKDTYSHIHWDSVQKRTVSVREAARLQSFPDSFRFAGAMNASFRQIGNAVPPLLGKAIGTSLRADLMRSAVEPPIVIEADSSEAA
jgi:DNA (cytosine-5)-methyltransferase 1